MLATFLPRKHLDTNCFFTMNVIKKSANGDDDDDNADDDDNGDYNNDDMMMTMMIMMMIRDPERRSRQLPLYLALEDDFLKYKCSRRYSDPMRSITL